MTVKILTDSGCDLPAEVLQTYDIEVIPLLVLLDGKEYVDGQDISPDDVYAAMRAGKLPRTGQTTQAIFEEVFTRYAKAGRKCIYIGFSSKMSGTCQTGMLTARAVKERFPDFQIEVIDSGCGSLGQGLVVQKAAEMARAGSDMTTITAAVKHWGRHTEHLFTVDDLEYLFRGGRVSRTSAFIGSLLSIKPILHVKEGLMLPLEKVRGKNKAIRRLLTLMQERCAKVEQTIAISHADDPEAASRLQQLIEETLGYKDFIVNKVGSVLGCHIGIGGVAVFFLNHAAVDQKI
ncbi:MAG: DegV family protein [Firmicutes bacterium]|nr:DegV family protein [Bacillota bacterium]